MKEINQDKNVRLCYFMAKTNKGIGYICMALQRPEKGSPSKTYRAGFSFCSPQEGKMFSKQKARLMATGRLATFARTNPNGNTVNRIEFESTAENITQVFSEGLSIAENSGLVPNWFRNRKELEFGLDANHNSKNPVNQKLLSA